MELTPQNIQKDFEDKRINKLTASNLLISIIENSESKRIRIESIRTLENLDLKNDAIFNLLENLVISDSDKEIRLYAAKYLKNNFIDNSIKPFKWVIENESDYECIVTVIQALIVMDLPESKTVLISQIKKISNNKYLNKERRIKNKFKKVLKKDIRQKKIIDYTKRELGLILINYLTILNLTNQYPNVFYELNPQSGLIKFLDLSDFMEYEVKGTPFGWKNNIRSLSEIMGLFSLNNLKEIDLSNNFITDVKEIPQLKELTHLILRNNKINEIENLNYIRRLPKLKYLDLRGNKIVKKLSLKDFDSKIKVLLKDISLN
ncbi:MAG: leucine-rich repeat domain-containing protein [Candidatus Thorarchaeota archaeon]